VKDDEGLQLECIGLIASGLPQDDRLSVEDIEHKNEEIGQTKGRQKS